MNDDDDHEDVVICFVVFLFVCEVDRVYWAACPDAIIEEEGGSVSVVELKLNMLGRLTDVPRVQWPAFCLSIFCPSSFI